MMTSPVDESPMTSPRTSAATRQAMGALSYMHRPPAILPNYGRKYGGGGVKLKTSVPRVLLYDNITQQTILSVHLTGLQSQQTKTNRELDMQQKSFQHRREIRVKQLENITQVPHHDDYIEFEKNLQQSSSTLHSSTLSLPRIGPVIRQKRKTKKKRKDGLDWSKHKGKTLTGYSESNDNIHSYNTSIEFPSILRNGTVISLESSPSTKGICVDLKGRVGFKEIKTTKGITKIFHSLPLPGGVPGNVENFSGQKNFNNVNEISLSENVISEIQEANKQPIFDIHNGNLTPLRISTSKSHVKQDEPSSIYKSLRKEVSLPVCRREKSLAIGEPLQDLRYERLRSSLILQDPPNEGYTELSPSFIREEPDWIERHRQQQLSAERRRRLRNKLRRRSSIEFIRRPDTAGSGAQEFIIGDQPSDSDDNDDTEPESRSNSALRKMANGNAVHF